MSATPAQIDRWNSRIADGLCGQCAKPLKSKTRCADCLSGAALKRRILKREVIAAYGGKCACCEIDVFEFLTLEHTNGDGGSERRRIKRFGNYFYAWLKDRGFPVDLGLAILCMNCNFSKGKYGYCPHKKLK